MAAELMIDHKIWAIVPAAGIGKRMQSVIPKQYMSLNGRPVIEHTINALLQNENITGLVIALQPDDAYWPDIQITSNKPVLLAAGGEQRSDSVLNAINELFHYQDFNKDTDWVMVHDAVRPCLCQQDIDKLATEVTGTSGGLLALPVRDTMKRQKTSDLAQVTVAETVERENLWHALTPQYFPALSLKKALQAAQQNNLPITDESSAMELAGYSPHLVEGKEDNIKITRPDDLRLAGLYLQSQLDE